MQDKEALEAAVRAFEDWEFRVLEKESGVDDEESNAEDMEHGSDVEIEQEINYQQLLVNALQVKNIQYRYFILGYRVCKCVWSPPVILLKDTLLEVGLIIKSVIIKLLHFKMLFHLKATVSFFGICIKIAIIFALTLISHDV